MLELELQLELQLEFQNSCRCFGQLISTNLRCAGDVNDIVTQTCAFLSVPSASKRVSRDLQCSITTESPTMYLRYSNTKLLVFSTVYWAIASKLGRITLSYFTLSTAEMIAGV